MRLELTFAGESEYGTHDPALKLYNKISECLPCHMLLSLLFCLSADAWNPDPETMTSVVSACFIYYMFYYFCK